MGAVGAFQWRGAYQEYTGSTLNPTPQQSQNMEPDSYMGEKIYWKKHPNVHCYYWLWPCEFPTSGYSMAVARTHTRQFTILGAPRFKHTGRVVFLSSRDTDKPIEFSGQVCTQLKRWDCCWLKIMLNIITCLLQKSMWVAANLQVNPEPVANWKRKLWHSDAPWLL